MHRVLCWSEIMDWFIYMHDHQDLDTHSICLILVVICLFKLLGLVLCVDDRNTLYMTMPGRSQIIRPAYAGLLLESE